MDLGVPNLGEISLKSSGVSFGVSWDCQGLHWKCHKTLDGPLVGRCEVVRVGDSWAIWEMTSEAMAARAREDKTLEDRLDLRPFKTRANVEKRLDKLNSGTPERAPVAIILGLLVNPEYPVLFYT